MFLQAASPAVALPSRSPTRRFNAPFPVPPHALSCVCPSSEPESGVWCCAGGFGRNLPVVVVRGNSNSTKPWLSYAGTSKSNATSMIRMMHSSFVLHLAACVCAGPFITRGTLKEYLGSVTLVAGDAVVTRPTLSTQ